MTTQIFVKAILLGLSIAAPVGADWHSVHPSHVGTGATHEMVWINRASGVVIIVFGLVALFGR